MSTTDDTPETEDFDFAGATEIPKKEEKVSRPILPKESAKKRIARLEKQIATSGSLTPKMIKEARKLAESPKGLVLDEFMQKHRLINIEIEQLLHAPLKKDGSFA